MPLATTRIRSTPMCGGYPAQVACVIARTMNGRRWADDNFVGAIHRSSARIKGAASWSRTLLGHDAGCARLIAGPH